MNRAAPVGGAIAVKAPKGRAMRTGLIGTALLSVAVLVGIVSCDVEWSPTEPTPIVDAGAFRRCLQVRRGRPCQR